MTILKNWNWCIDFSKSTGQKDAQIAPVFFLSRSQARKHNDKCFPRGIIRKVEIKIKK